MEIQKKKKIVLAERRSHGAGGAHSSCRSQFKDDDERLISNKKVSQFGDELDEESFKSQTMKSSS